MSQKRGRWIVNLVLLLALVTFVGVSLFPLLGNVLQENQPSAVGTPAPKPTQLGVKESDLQDQAKGYELVLQREPDSKTSLRGLLEVRLQLGDLKGATDALEKLAALSPEQTEYMVLLAQAKQQLGDREAAATAYRSVLTSNPGDMNALQGLVSLLLQQKRPEAAIGLLQDTLKTATQTNQVQPGSIDTTSVQLLLGQVYINEQRFAEALTIYDEAVKTNKQDFRPVLAKAIVLQRLGKAAEAKPLFTTAVALAPPQYKDQIKQMATETPTAAAATPTPAATSTPAATPTPTSSPSVSAPAP
ncbi:tetratricopeptide repeat protein [Microcoleus sp. FACHB-831]|uniref:tetratricopeptide repeat protein n=1 Tax=Microcoleus sp. FACHB-831 TaxID=2692827 RepID=UPI00168949A1|nr:tetratricopeptide repeat protein [Microcoleus sp. FACHB-831]MBD1923033.1 tetratricopeptide repeat protein [Microcoleus sp. FACHB-831]